MSGANSQEFITSLRNLAGDDGMGGLAQESSIKASGAAAPAEVTEELLWDKDRLIGNLAGKLRGQYKTHVVGGKFDYEKIASGNPPSMVDNLVSEDAKIRKELDGLQGDVPSVDFLERSLARRAGILHEAVNKGDWDITGKLLGDLPELVRLSDNNGRNLGDTLLGKVHGEIFDGRLAGLSSSVSKLSDLLKSESVHDGLIESLPVIEGAQFSKHLSRKLPEGTLAKAAEIQTFVEKVTGLKGLDEEILGSFKEALSQSPDNPYLAVAKTIESVAGWKWKSGEKGKLQLALLGYLNSLSDREIDSGSGIVAKMLLSISGQDHKTFSEGGGLANKIFARLISRNQTLQEELGKTAGSSTEASPEVQSSIPEDLNVVIGLPPEPSPDLSEPEVVDQQEVPIVSTDSNIGEEESSPETPIEESAEDSKVPDWLKFLRKGPPPQQRSEESSPETPIEESAEDSDLPDWLKGFESLDSSPAKYKIRRPEEKLFDSLEDTMFTSSLTNLFKAQPLERTRSLIEEMGSPSTKYEIPNPKGLFKEVVTMFGILVEEAVKEIDNPDSWLTRTDGLHVPTRRFIDQYRGQENDAVQNYLLGGGRRNLTDALSLAAIREYLDGLWINPQY